MKYLGRFGCWVVLVVGLVEGAFAQVKVACLGDSITAGAGSAPRGGDVGYTSYPSVMGRLLGEGFEVRGFGASGHTLRADGRLPYGESKAFAQALAFAPDLAVIMLGTNDSLMGGAEGDWVERVGLLVAPLRKARPGVRVLLASPPAMKVGREGLTDARRANLVERAPRLAEIAAALREAARTIADVEFVDVHSVLRGRDVTDGVHPNAFGAERLAYRLAGAVAMEPHIGTTPWSQLMESRPDATSSRFHGFRRADFSLENDEQSPCIIVAPDRVAAGAPWIWRARFFGHEPTLDRALLDRGFHLAYVDVAGLFGSPLAVARMAQFHSFCESVGLSPQPVLEGMSRGGLAIVEYAKAHPQRVAALYGDNPVADLRSWPGGRSGKRSAKDWADALASWKLQEPEAWDLEVGPLTALEPLARAGVPLFLVLGTEDRTVPAHENGERLRSAYLAAGGCVEVWRKPGFDHHPHGLDPVAPLLHALLRAAGQRTVESQPSLTPTPSAEYRGKSAGWGGGTWRTAFESLAALAADSASEPPMDVVFLGDSITQGLTGHTDRLAHPDGSRAFDRYQGHRRAVSVGLSGDRTEHILYRIEAGSLDAFRPRVIVLQIGVNNINAAKHTGPETFEGIVAVIGALRSRFPSTHVVITGPFPAGRDPMGQVRQSIVEVHARLAVHTFDEHTHYLDLSSEFIDEAGAPRPTLGRDRLHITGAGKEAWMKAIEPTLQTLLD